MNHDAGDGRRPRGRFRRILGTLHDWAESGWSGPATASWGFLQGSVIPGPSDALVLPLSIADPPRALRLALWATLGSVAGGAIAYAIGAGAAAATGTPLAWFGVSAPELADQRARFDEWGWWLVFASTMSPLSTKVVCIAAGLFGFPFGSFVAALASGRLLRFTAMALAGRVIGRRLAANPAEAAAAVRPRPRHPAGAP